MASQCRRGDTIAAERRRRVKGSARVSRCCHNAVPLTAATSDATPQTPGRIRQRRVEDPQPRPLALHNVPSVEPRRGAGCRVVRVRVKSRATAKNVVEMLVCCWLPPGAARATVDPTVPAQKHGGLHLILVQQHVGNALCDVVRAPTVGAHELSLVDVYLRMTRTGGVHEREALKPRLQAGG